MYTHLDGVGWAVGPDGQSPNFPNARHLVPGGEITAFGAGLRTDTEGLNVLRAHGLVDAIELPHEVAPGIVIEPAPGHTPSNGIVRVQDGDGRGRCSSATCSCIRRRCIATSAPSSSPIPRPRSRPACACSTTPPSAAPCSTAICGMRPAAATSRKDGDRYELV